MGRTYPCVARGRIRRALRTFGRTLRAHGFPRCRLPGGRYRGGLARCGRNPFLRVRLHCGNSRRECPRPLWHARTAIFPARRDCIRAENANGAGWEADELGGSPHGQSYPRSADAGDRGTNGGDLRRGAPPARSERVTPGHRYCRRPILERDAGPAAGSPRVDGPAVCAADARGASAPLLDRGPRSCPSPGAGSFGVLPARWGAHDGGVPRGVLRRDQEALARLLSGSPEVRP